MKRTWIWLLSAVILLALCACNAAGGDPGKGSGETETQPPQSSQPSQPQVIDEPEPVYDDSLIVEIMSIEGEYSPAEGMVNRYSYHIPSLVGDSAVIQAVNRDMEEISALAHGELDDIRVNDSCVYDRIEWQSFWLGSLLSLAVEAEDIDGYTQCMVVNYDFAEDRLLDNTELVNRLGMSEEEFLWSARRTAARTFDAQYLDWLRGDDWYLDPYYLGSYDVRSILDQRAETIAALDMDSAMLCLDEEGCVLGFSIFTESGMGYAWYSVLERMDLDFSDITQTAADEVVTATLVNNHVYLSFADTEEAAWYLTGGWDDESAFDVSRPGNKIELGPDHRYEVQGLYSTYTDLYLGGFGNDYWPYLILVTDQNTLELVDVFRCAQSGVFCAMPVPGRFGNGDGVKLQYGAVEDGESGYETVFVLDGREKINLAPYVFRGQTARPEGAWTAAVDEVKSDGGWWSIMANLVVDGESGFVATTTVLDELTASYDGNMWALGMTDEGIVCGYILWPDGEGAPLFGTLTWRWQDDIDESGQWNQTLLAKVSSGASPYGQEGEWEEFWRVEGYEGGDPEGVW